MTSTSAPPIPSTPPPDVNALFQDAFTHHQSGALDQAYGLYQRVLEYEPQHFNALHLSGVIAHQRNEHARAEHLIVHALSLNPSSVPALTNLCSVLNATHQYKRALQYSAQAIAIKPDFALAWLHQATAQKGLGMHGAAIETLTHLTAFDARNAKAWNQLADTLAELNRHTEAVQSYARAIELNVNEPAYCWFNQGNSLRILKQLDAARASYEQAIVLKPDLANAYLNLGLVMVDLNQPALAERNYQLCLQYQPNNLMALANLAQLMIDYARTDEAQSTLQRALEIEPNSFKIKGILFSLKQLLCDWSAPIPSDIEAQFLDDLFANPAHQFSPLPLMALPQITPEQLLKAGHQFAHTQWSYHLAQPPLSRIKPNPNELNLAKRKLRIGYLSADFRDHALSYLLQDVLRLHSLDDFEIYLYAYGSASEDATRIALKQMPHPFIELSHMSDQAAAEKIAHDGIDILVDLTGYTTHMRLGITALRPAPIIVSWLGYVGTLGERRLADYIIGDAIISPLAHAADFSEAIVQMPDCYQPNRALSNVSATPTRAAENLPEDAFIFCNFNLSFKFNLPLWDDYCAILRAVPNSILWIAPSTYPEVLRNLRRETASRGVAPERIIMATRTSLAQHQARLGLADLVLDCFPYGAGTNASDALRCGVPLITRIGQTYASRMASSLLNCVNLNELITTDRSDFINLAIKLASNPSTLSAIRNKLATTLPNCALFDTPRLTKNLEKAYQYMHQQYHQGQSPQSFAVADVLMSLPQNRH